MRKVLAGHDTAECLVVVRGNMQDAVGTLPGVSMIPVSVPGPSLVQEALLPFMVWPKLEKRLSNFDVIVTRWAIASPSFLAIVKKKAVFTEHHTKELEEISLARGYKPYVRTLLEKRYAPLILREARGIIGVTDEIRKYELGRAGIDCPSMVLSNGIFPEDVPISSHPAFDGKSLDIVFMSSHFAPWQGLDRLLAGLNKYRGEVRVTLHLIGRVSPALKNKIQHMAVEKHIVFHGFKQGKVLDEILSSCQLAVGSLALHRKGLKEACALKVREYTVRGLPFVVAYDDPDFPPGLPWILKIPAGESAVEISKIIHFVEKLRTFPSVSEEMRAFAEKKLSWTVKMKQLLDFIRKNI